MGNDTLHKQSLKQGLNNWSKLPNVKDASKETWQTYHDTSLTSNHEYTLQRITDILNNADNLPSSTRESALVNATTIAQELILASLSNYQRNIRSQTPPLESESLQQFRQ